MKVRTAVGSPDKARLREVEFLADSGAWYTVLPPSIVGELKLNQVAARSLVLADGRKIEAPFIDRFHRDSLLTRAQDFLSFYSRYCFKEGVF